MANTQTVITPEVATELLCKPGLPMSGKERRMLFRARYNPLFVIVEIDGKNIEQRALPDGGVQIKYAPLGIAHRLDYRMQQKSWAQLMKWDKRAKSRRQMSQDQYQLLQRRQTKLGSKTGEANEQDIKDLLWIAQAMAALTAKVALLDIFIDALDDEFRRRKKLWESVAKAGAPKFAKQLKKAITNEN